MALKTSVKQSLNDYMEYRRNKRELLGPDLLDTAVDISKATYISAVEVGKNVAEATQQTVNDTVQTITDTVDKVYELDRKLTNKAVDTARNAWDFGKSKTIQLKDVMNDYKERKLEPFFNRVKDGIGNLRDKVKDQLARLTPEETTIVIDERSMFDKIRSGIAEKKLQMADGLESIAGKLRGESVDRRKTLDEEKVETPVEAREVEQEKAEDTTKKEFVKEETLEDEKKRREMLEVSEATKMPVRTVEERLRKTDGKENATAKDYMLAGGVSAFLQQFNGAELEGAKEVAKHDMKQLESIDAQIAGIDADIKELMEIRERLNTIRENLYEKYQIGHAPTKEDYESAYAEIAQFGQETKQEVQPEVKPKVKPEVKPEELEVPPIVRPTDMPVEFEPLMTDEDLEFLQSIDELRLQQDGMQQ